VGRPDLHAAFTGDFYGGRMTADAEVTKTTPFTVRQLTADIRDADVAKIAEERRGSPIR
jgi:hypothetical protein